MTLVDVLAIALVLASGGAFIFGESALSRTEDLRALYWLLVGIISLRAAIQMARPGSKE